MPFEPLPKLERGLQGSLPSIVNPRDVRVHVKSESTVVHTTDLECGFWRAGPRLDGCPDLGPKIT